MKVKIKLGRRKIIPTTAESAIMRYGGKMHEKYIKKKINIDRVKDLVGYSDL